MPRTELIKGVSPELGIRLNVSFVFKRSAMMPIELRRKVFDATILSR